MESKTEGVWCPKTMFVLKKNVISHAVDFAHGRRSEKIKAFWKDGVKKMQKAYKIRFMIRRLMKKTGMGVLMWMNVILLASCTVKYSAVGVDIPTEAKTINIKQFQNNASLINIRLSNEMTTKLKDKFRSSTRLSLVEGRADLSITGEITDYAVSAVSVGAEKATMNRLTISVKISYENVFDEEKNINRSFSRYLDFSGSMSLSQVEDALTSDICDVLVDDIFAATVGNW
jgi:hypothetical protein